jgi:aryl-alcohol dehydrogenase-like predicted oxidoreductase
VKKVLLGSSNQSVSSMALGCLRFGTKTDDYTASKLLDTYINTGGFFLDTANWSSYCCIQQAYTYLNPKPGSIFDGEQVSVDDDLMDYCNRNDFPIVAYSPLLNGAYSREDRSFPPEYSNMDAEIHLKKLKEVSSQIGATVNQVILPWMLHSKQTIIPIIAGSTVEQLQENLGAISIILSKEQISYLNGV